MNTTPKDLLPRHSIISPGDYVTINDSFYNVDVYVVSAIRDQAVLMYSTRVGKCCTEIHLYLSSIDSLLLINEDYPCVHPYLKQLRDMIRNNEEIQGEHDKKIIEFKL